MGYARDFIGAMESVLPAVVERGVRVIANAGGVNPVACARGGARRRARARRGGQAAGSASSRATTCCRASTS